MSDKTPQLDDLKARRDSLLVEAEIKDLEAALHAASMMEGTVTEAFGDWVDPKDHIYDTPGFNTMDGRVSVPGDRDQGDNPPFWTSEQEHGEQRGIARYIATVDEIGISALENLTNYVIGTGFTYAAEPRASGVEDVARACNAAWESFDESNGWAGDLEREFFSRTHRDGEAFLWVHSEDATTLAELVEPEFITEPDKPWELEDWAELTPGLDWKYGIATKHNRPSRREAYFVEWYGRTTEWELLKAGDVIASRINVDRNIKRGLSDFYAVYLQLDRASKLLGNTLQGAAIQACIAYIRKHAAGTTSSDISSISKDGTYQRPTKNGSVTQRYKKFLPGTVIDTNTDFAYGPMGTPQGGQYIPIIQAALRYVGSRWNMPEYMISGDASNGNFASTLVAEAPFTKSCEAKQSVMVRNYSLLWWRVMAEACRRGEFRRYGVGNVSELRQMVACSVTPPEVAVRNRLEEHQIREGEFNAGVLSAETWAEETGRDFDKEKARGADRANMTPPPIGPQLGVTESWLGYP